MRRKPPRACDECRRGLPGRRRHGFISRDGRRVLCAECAWPPPKKKGG